MYALEVVVHLHPAVLARNIEFPHEAITRFFRVFHVEFSFDMTGDALQDPDPDGTAPPEAFEPDYQEIARKLEPAEDRGPTHLLLGWRLDGDGSINGKLLARRRGVAAVFAGAEYMARPGGLLQVAIHELGHCLNLHHPLKDPAPAYGTAMHQAGGRTGPIDPAWATAVSEDLGFPGGLTTVPEVEAYPLGIRARRWIQNRPYGSALAHLVRPWGSEFEDGPLPEDTGDPVGTVEIVPERRTFRVGDPFAFELRVSQHGEESALVPRVLAFERRSVDLLVQRPNGRVYRHRSPSLVCDGTMVDLPNGGLRSRSWSIFDGPGYRMFPEPGVYAFRAYVPSLSAMSFEVRVPVEPRSDGLAVDRALGRHLVHGAPRDGSQEARRLEGWLESRKGGVTVLRAHASLLLATWTSDPEACQALLRTAMAKLAPRRVRQKALAFRVRSAERFSSSFDAELQAIRESCDPVADEHLLEGLSQLSR